MTRKRVFNQMEDMKGKIRVYARVRPILPFETAQGQTEALTFPDPLTLNLTWRREKREYQFDSVFQPSCSQAQVLCRARPFIFLGPHENALCVCIIFELTWRREKREYQFNSVFQPCCSQAQVQPRSASWQGVQVGRPTGWQPRSRGFRDT